MFCDGETMMNFSMHSQIRWDKIVQYQKSVKKLVVNQSSQSLMGGCALKKREVHSRSDTDQSVVG